jgi:hypothetical protein
MVFLTAAALATVPPAPRPSAVAEATVTIRVVTGVRLKLDGSSNADAPIARDSTVKSADGTSQAIKVIEFQ